MALYLGHLQLWPGYVTFTGNWAALASSGLRSQFLLAACVFRACEEAAASCQTHPVPLEGSPAGTHPSRDSLPSGEQKPGVKCSWEVGSRPGGSTILEAC